MTSAVEPDKKRKDSHPCLNSRPSRTRISWRDDYSGLSGLHMPIEKGENYKHISQFTEQTKEEAELPVPPSYLLNATVEDDLDHEYQERIEIR